jgi:hypothetical protein
MRNIRIILIAGAATLGGCGVTVRGRPLPGNPDASRPMRPATNIAVAKSGARDPSSAKTVCRGASGIGWLAVDYLDDASCIEGRKDRHNAAVVITYRDQPVGARLEICADEHVPTGWMFATWVDADGRCSDEQPNAGPDHHTVKQIRRVN